jgi:glycosyltransferase involved in cell wall biosynthesis
LPVVASDVGSNREVIEDGESGFVVQGEVKSLAGALATLLADGGLRDQFGSAGRELAGRQFGVRDIKENHQKTYLGLGD